MYYIKFCRAPSQYWVGQVVYKNGTFFSYGRTLDHMVKNVKTRLFNFDKVPASSIILETRQSLPSEMALDKMTQMFTTRYWLPRNNDLETKETIIEKETEVVEPEVKTKAKRKQKTEEATMSYDKHSYEIKDGKLIVWGVVKVAEYNLGLEIKTTPEVPAVVERPILNQSKRDYQDELSRWKQDVQIALLNSKEGGVDAD